jgi:hypothetical protein
MSTIRWVALGAFGIAEFLRTTSAGAVPKIVTHKQVPEQLLVAVGAGEEQPRAVELGAARVDDASLEVDGPEPLRPYLAALQELPETIEATTVLWFGGVSVRVSTSAAGVETALNNRDLLKLLRTVELTVRDKRVEVRLLLSSKDRGYAARGVMLVPLHEGGAHLWGGQVEGRVDVAPTFDSIEVNGSAGVTLELNSKTGFRLPAGVALRPTMGAGLRGGRSGLWVVAQIHAEVYSEDWFAEEPVRLRFEAGFGTPGFKTSSADASHRLHAEPTFAARVSAPIPSRPNLSAGFELSRRSSEVTTVVFVRLRD